MTELRPLQPWEYQLCVPDAGDWVDVEKLAKHGWSLWDGTRLIGCAGVLPYWPGVGEAWLAIAPTAQLPHDLRPGLRALRAKLATLTYRRIQADVLPELRHWMRILGFEFESRMPLYGPDGSTYHRYVRIS